MLSFTATKPSQNLRVIAWWCSSEKTDRSTWWWVVLMMPLLIPLWSQRLEHHHIFAAVPLLWPATSVWSSIMCMCEPAACRPAEGLISASGCEVKSQSWPVGSQIVQGNCIRGNGARLFLKVTYHYKIWHYLFLPSASTVKQGFSDST